MLAIRLLFLPTVWILVGAVVAAIYDYFEALGTTAKVLTAVAAVVFWPVLPFGSKSRSTASRRAGGERGFREGLRSGVGRDPLLPGAGE
ncbi:hypothetical protein BH20ACT14_BH20ACT14_07070 [soil metagenome]